MFANLSGKGLYAAFSQRPSQEVSKSMGILKTFRNYICYCGIDKDKYKALKKDAYASNFVIWGADPKVATVEVNVKTSNDLTIKKVEAAVDLKNVPGSFKDITDGNGGSSTGTFYIDISNL